MKLDTAQLKTRIRDELSKTDQYRKRLQEQLKRLEQENSHLRNTLEAVEAIERIASEFEENLPEPASSSTSTSEKPEEVKEEESGTGEPKAEPNEDTLDKYFHRWA